ncbi:hypothetical protein ACH5RR_006640, partial [Cinchona calisaya]
VSFFFFCEGFFFLFFAKCDFGSTLRCHEGQTKLTGDNIGFIVKNVTVKDLKFDFVASNSMMT